MTATDPGHIENLNEEQARSLKEFWICLIEKIKTESHVTLDNFLNSVLGNELFHTFANDNPDVTLLRYLRARKWNIDLALTQLIEALQWKCHANVRQIAMNGESCLDYKEIVTGKTYFIGYDKVGRPINYVSIRDHVKGQFPSEATENFTIFSMETGRKILRYPVESVTVIFDMTDFSMKNMDYQHAQFLINLLQNYYPESLGLALIVNSPRIFYGCWYIIKSWLDPVVRNKIHFVNNIDDLTEYIDLSTLPKRLNGTQPNFSYIPPGEQDMKVLSAFRTDSRGNKKAKQHHEQKALDYLRITLAWAHEKDSSSTAQQREKTMTELQHAYEQLIPYIHTTTHYHRNGLISEPIFDETYQRIQNENQEQILYF